jgi:hypothetical protein
MAGGPGHGEVLDSYTRGGGGWERQIYCLRDSGAEDGDVMEECRWNAVGSDVLWAKEELGRGFGRGEEQLEHLMK